MLRKPPTRAVTFSIGDFSRADQALLRAAYEADLPMSYIGFRQDKPFVMAVGHPGAIAMPDAKPEGSVPCSLKQINGIDKPTEKSEPSEFIQRLLRR